MGRGESGNILSCAVEREIEDIDAMIKAAGGWAFLFGTSSGAPLALAAARSGLAVRRLGMYEAPFACPACSSRSCDSSRRGPG
jgi:hypothetical protein